MNKSCVCRADCQKSWGQRASEGDMQDKEINGHRLSAANRLWEEKKDEAFETVVQLKISIG